jgi:hypothetical protein
MVPSMQRHGAPFIRASRDALTGRPHRPVMALGSFQLGQGTALTREASRKYAFQYLKKGIPAPQNVFAIPEFYMPL